MSRTSIQGATLGLMSDFEYAVRRLRGMRVAGDPPIDLKTKAKEFQRSFGIDEFKILDAARQDGPYFRGNQLVITHAEMPTPDMLVTDRNGQLCAAMFYYAAADQRLDQIAAEQGYDLCSVSMLYALDDDHPLSVRCLEGDGSVVDDWQPETPPGWSFALKHDTEEGPVALFIRLKSAAGGPW
ncbi:MAG: hypothetical protein AB7U62_04135 [Pseudolabrys sp.]